MCGFVVFCGILWDFTGLILCDVIWAAFMGGGSVSVQIVQYVLNVTYFVTFPPEYVTPVTIESAGPVIDAV